MKIFTKGCFFVLFVVSQVAVYATPGALESATAREISAQAIAEVSDMLAKATHMHFGVANPLPQAPASKAMAVQVVKDKSVPTLSAYPNPTKGIIRLSLTQAEGHDAYKIRISNTIGKVVRTLDLHELEGGSEITLDLSHLPAGIYFYSLLVNEKMTETKRLVLQR